MLSGYFLEQVVEEKVLFTSGEMGKAPKRQ